MLGLPLAQPFDLLDGDPREGVLLETNSYNSESPPPSPWTETSSSALSSNCEEGVTATGRMLFLMYLCLIVLLTLFHGLFASDPQEAVPTDIIWKTIRKNLEKTYSGHRPDYLVSKLHIL